jgi:predicted 3-demethylubiquinone-9 3-methyltransferase (glyoxalase superfamily)
MATKRKSKAPARKGTSSRKPQAPQPSGIQVISPCLWFDSEAEEAARFYVSVFEKAKIVAVTHYPAVGKEIHGREAGSVLTVEFVLNGVPFTALNGGPLFKFNESVSLQVLCRTQAEIDYYWEKLGEGGDPAARQCGWLKDKYGLSWQVAPQGMAKMLGDAKSKAGQRVFAALLDMKKLDIAALKAAAKG